MNVRTVEDVVRVPDPRRPMRIEVDGTKVGDDALSTDPETLFPLQGALGYEITQSLFIGEHTVLVEGPSDILYLQAANAVLKAKGQPGLDPRWVLCPSGGLDKVSAFVSLFRGNKLHVAVLTDLAKGQKGKIDQLRRSALLRSGHVLTVADFVSQDEADIEDLFTRKLYVSLLNAAYGLKVPHALTVERLMTADPNSERNVKKAEAFFRLLPPEFPNFNHYDPAYWLIQNPDFLAQHCKEVTTTLDRFAKVFDALSNLVERKE